MKPSQPPCCVVVEVHGAFSQELIPEVLFRTTCLWWAGMPVHPAMLIAFAVHTIQGVRTTACLREVFIAFRLMASLAQCPLPSHALLCKVLMACTCRELLVAFTQLCEVLIAFTLLRSTHHHRVHPCNASLRSFHCLHIPPSSCEPWLLLLLLPSIGRNR